MPDITLPTPGVTPGPQYADQINNAISAVNSVIDTGRLSAESIINSSAEGIENPESPLNAAVLAVAGSVVPPGVPYFYRATSLTDPRPPAAPGQPVYWSFVTDDTAARPVNMLVGDTYETISTEATPWSPADISSILGWWDERVSPPSDGSDYGTVLVRAGSAPNMVAVTEGVTDSPQYDADGLAGKPGIYFPASSGMTVSGPVSWGTGPLTVFGILKMGAVTSSAQTVFNGQPTAGGNQSLALGRIASGGSWFIRRGGTSRTFAHSSASDGLIHTFAVIFNGTSSELFIDGSSLGVASGSPGSNAPTGFQLGIRDGSAAVGSISENLSGGLISSPFVMGGVPTLEQRSAAFTFLSSRIS